MKRCPICGAAQFGVSAHVVQDWIVDERGGFIRCVDDCIEVTHFPDDDDIWSCTNCKYSACGSEFNVNEVD